MIITITCVGFVSWMWKRDQDRWGVQINGKLYFIKSKCILGNGNRIRYVDNIEMEIMTSELMGMALGVFLGYSVVVYIVWELLSE